MLRRLAVVFVAIAVNAVASGLTADLYATESTFEIQGGDGRVVSISPSLSLGQFSDVEATLEALSSKIGDIDGLSVAEVVADLTAAQNQITNNIQPELERRLSAVEADLAKVIKAVENDACERKAGIRLLAHYCFDSGSGPQSGTGTEMVDCSKSGTLNTGLTKPDSSDLGYAKLSSGESVGVFNSTSVDVESFRFYDWGREFGVMFWFKRTGITGYQGLVNQGYHAQGSWEVRMGRENGGTMLGGGIETGHNGGDEPWDHVHLNATLNEWHFVGMSYSADKERVYFYLDGEHIEEVQSSDRGNMKVMDAPVSVGYAGDGQPHEQFVGSMDDIRIFDRFISADDFHCYYEMTKGRYS
jgi:hypothetical protein